MEHKEIRRLMAERIGMLLEATDLPKELRPYQREALVAIQKWLEDPNGTHRGYVEHATGLGKTVLFSALISYCTGLRTLVIVPSKILVEQTARFIVEFSRGIIGHLSGIGEIRNEDGDVIALKGHSYFDIVVTTDESFKIRTRQIARDYEPQFIIWDECHWGYTLNARLALKLFPEAVVIGFSATPNYLTNAKKAGYLPMDVGNGRVLYGAPDRLAKHHFETCLDVRSVEWGIEAGWLAPLAWGTIEFDLSLDDVPLVEGPGGLDYDGGALQDLMTTHWPLLCETVKRLYQIGEAGLPNRQAFAICPSVFAAEKLAEVIAGLGIPTACITGNTPNDERNRMLQGYRENKIRLLTSVMVLREGWDAPNAEVCLMLRPTRSRVLYLQSMGRVLRRETQDSKKVALVIDAHFQNTVFAPLSAPGLLGAVNVAEYQVPSGGVVLAPRDTEVASPYLPPGVTPRLVVVPAFQLEEWADFDGTMTIDGEIWASLAVLCHKVKMGFNMLTMLVSEWKGPLRTRPARISSGKVRDFYPLTDVQALVIAWRNGSFQTSLYRTFRTS